MNPTFGSKAMRYAWFAEMFALASVVSSIVGKVTQRYLPLSTLCMINLSFPDEATNRMKLALRVFARDSEQAGSAV